MLNTQDVRFMSKPMKSQHNGYFIFNLASDGDIVPWPTKANVIIHELSNAKIIVGSETLAVADMMRAMRNNHQTYK